MKKAGNALAVLGIILIIYSILEKYIIGTDVIKWGAMEIDAISGVIMANALMLIGVSVKLWDK